MRPEGLAGRAAALAIAAALSLACAGLAARLNPPEGPLDEATVASALNEALRVAAERAVDTLSEPAPSSAAMIRPSRSLLLPSKKELNELITTISALGNRRRTATAKSS